MERLYRPNMARPSTATSPAGMTDPDLMARAPITPPSSPDTPAPRYGVAPGWLACNNCLATQNILDHCYTCQAPAAASSPNVSPAAREGTDRFLMNPMAPPAATRAANPNPG